MDAAWAVVAGVVATFLGSAVIPWIRDAIESRRRRREKVIAARLEAIDALAAAISARSVDAEAADANVAVAALRVALFAPGGSQLERLAENIIEFPRSGTLQELGLAVGGMNAEIIANPPGTTSPPDR